MTNGQFPTRTETARQIGKNIRATLKSQGRDLDWLANQLDTSTHRLLEAFTDGVPMWVVFDAANALDVPADTLVAA